MGNRIVITKNAQNDLDNIWLYIAQDNVFAARKVIFEIIDNMNILIDNPKAGMARDDIKKGVRRLIMGKYLTLYRIKNGTIQIMRVIHGATIKS